ncbi:MAG: putative MarR-family transcriptional regulator [Ilumatobacteraceae bacterium]|nr:putative MarR-family transcriptional regulator [Ilumatobacteraceae bacterium]
MSAGIEITESHVARVGDISVRRALPMARRRTVGAWCFIDHMGPSDVPLGIGSSIGPHPHIGLQTVTWLVEGELLHRDSLGSEQVIRPGQLNLMTAGHGIAHAEEGLGRATGRAHGAQLWVAMPESTRHGAPAFEHQAELPQLELGSATATILIGELGGGVSPARRDTDHAGIDLDVRPGTTVLPTSVGHEHAIVVLAGVVQIDGATLTPGHLGYVAPGRDELAISCTEPARLLVLSGVPFPERISMFWNFVGRDHDELERAGDEWNVGHERFGSVASPLERIPSPTPPWRHA